MTKEYFWSISIEKGHVQGAIWTVSDEKAHVLAVAPACRWEETEDIINAADTTLSAATQFLPEDAEEPVKTVFGVPSSWVSEGQIKKEHLDPLRELCGKLSLEPSGFVIIPEAIANYVKSTDGGALNGVIIGIGEESVDISVFKLGNLMGSVSIARTVSLVDDIVEGLARFQSIDALPSRILLYNSNDKVLENAKEDLLKVDWLGEYKSKLKFLHTPQVEVVEAVKKLIAISLAGANEIAKVTSIDFDKKDDGIEDVKDNSEPSQNNKDESIEDNEDIKKPVEEESEKLEEDNDTHSNLSQLGFALDEDVEEKDPKPHSPFISPSVKPRVPSIDLSNKVRSAKKFVAVKKISMPSLSFAGQKPLLLFLAGMTLILIGAFIAWWNIPQADVTLYVAPQRLENRAKVVVDPAASSVDKSKVLVPGKTVKVTVNGDKNRSATGTKTVGEKAKGKVIIRNGTSVNLNLPGGTLLVGGNSLRFNMDQSASVSAALSPSTPGSATVNITAEAIGAEYNVAKNESFKVGNYPKSEVDAIADTDFSGGSSREIVAVSKDDLKFLEEDLTKTLLEEADLKLSETLSDGELLVKESKSGSISKKTFNHKAGDEANSVRLEMSMEVTALVIQKSQINTLAEDYLKDQVPPGYVLRDEQIQIDFNEKGSSVGNGVWQFDTVFSANLLPVVKIEEIQEKIKAKSEKAADNYLRSTIGGFVRAEIIPSPRLPGKLGVLPHIGKNIHISISAEE